MPLTTIEIAGRLVGEGQPCYVIAEAGVNHNGDPELARRLIDIAAEAGADAVKFQKRTPADILTAEALQRPYTVPTSLGATYGEHRERLELSAEVYQSLIEHAKSRNITLLASGWDVRSIDFLEELGMPAYKIASADCTNLPLIEYIAKLGKPVLLSTGMSDLSEVDEAVATIRRHNDQLVLFQCTSTYPADNDQLNLRVILTYKQRYGCVVGYSGHERGLAPTEAAVALGASVIERHFTIDRTMIGPDHAASLEPMGLQRLVRNVRNIEKALGSTEKQMMPAERAVRDRLAKSVVARHDIPAGTTITADMLTVKGPGTGLKPNVIPLLLGVVAKSDIAGDTLIPMEAIKWRLVLTPDVRARARKIRLVAMDVDGVLTDAGMYYTERGDELKKFNTRDGMGVAQVRAAGLTTAILTGESTELVVRRGEKLKIDHVFVGVSDKLTCMNTLLQKLDLSLEQVAYIGDDINDFELLSHVGLAVAVRDASRLPKSVAHLITEAKGGEGAVRELCEIILEAQHEHPPLPEA